MAQSPTISEEMPLNGSGDGHAESPQPELAQCRRDVLQGRPFMGTVQRVNGRKSVFVDVIETPITLSELAGEEGVYGTIKISMPTVEEPVRIELGGRESDSGSKETEDREALARLLERAQSSKDVEERIADITDRYEEKVEVLRERLEHQKERAEDYREKLRDAEDRHREEIRDLEERHREEKRELLDEIESLREERIEIREQTKQSPTEIFMNEIAKNAPGITSDLKQIVANLAQGRPNGGSLPANNRSAETPHGTSNDTNDTEMQSAEPSEATQQQRQVTPQEAKQGIVKGMLLTCQQYMQGNIETQDELAEALNEARGQIEQKFGVQLDKQGWVQATSQLAEMSIQNDWPEDDVADMVEPIARQFAPQGSMAAMVLKNSPPDDATQQLLTLVERDVPQDVQSLIVDVLGILKNRL